MSRSRDDEGSGHDQTGMRKRPANRLTAAERSAQAREKAIVMHSKHDARDTTKAARAKADERFLKQVDPDGALPEDERERRMREARRAHMLALALKSSRVRTDRAGNRKRRSR